MKIIEKKKEGWQKRICTGEGNSNIGCGSILLLDIDDVKVIRHTLLDGTTDTFYSFICPVCGAITDIASAELPVSIIENRKKKTHTKVKSIFGRRK